MTMDFCLLGTLLAQKIIFVYELCLWKETEIWNRVENKNCYKLLLQILSFEL